MLPHFLLSFRTKSFRRVACAHYPLIPFPPSPVTLPCLPRYCIFSWHLSPNTSTGPNAKYNSVSLLKLSVRWTVDQSFLLDMLSLLDFQAVPSLGFCPPSWTTPLCLICCRRFVLTSKCWWTSWLSSQKSSALIPSTLTPGLFHQVSAIKYHTHLHPQLLS